MKKNKSVKRVRKSEIPIGVKVISVLYYLGAVFLLFMGILSFIGSSFVGDYLLRSESDPLVGALTGGVFAVIGVVFILFAILSFFIGRGLWNAKQWARVLVIIFAVLGVLNGLTTMIGGNVFIGIGIVTLIINGVIGGYIAFSKSVSRAFQN